MTPTAMRILMVILALLASGLGYAWFASQVDEVARLESIETSHLTDTVTVPPPEPWTDSTTVSRRFETSTNGEIEYSPATSLIGRIVDAQGEGLNNIKIRLRTTRGSDRRFILRQARTDVKGGFELEDLDPRSVYLLFTEALDGYPGYRLDGFALGSLPTPFEIRLSRPTLVDAEGTIVDAEHVPVKDFTLTIESLDTNYPTRTVTSDASGQFRLVAFPAGELKIYTATPDYFRIQGLYASAEAHSNLTLVIDRGGYRIAGSILDENGKPISSARIKLTSMIVANEYHSHASRTRMSDTLGQFEFTGLGGLAHTIAVYANGYKPQVENREFQSFADYIDIRLRR